MRNLHLLLALLSIWSLPAQEPKGITPIPHSTFHIPPATRAVVVGISDYQDPAIPDLQFAHRDAEAFANFLRSPAGGRLDKDHLLVLTNSQATNAQFAAALDWLRELSREGDRAIIYFSGHGDVDRSFTELGFLLCWNAPAGMYMAGGAFSLAYFQAIVQALSEVNKAKVFIISDACHAGNLAGSPFGGPQAITANLTKQYADEIKIISCQPTEYSIEGERWGGGRSVFSYHFVNGLYGKADYDKDGKVTILEINRYLEDHVTADVAPASQVPLVFGVDGWKLSLADAAVSDKKHPVSTETVWYIGDDDLEAQVLDKADEAGRAVYHAFQESLKRRRFFDAVDCADTLFQRLLQNPEFEPLFGNLNRNYAAALQDDAQEVMNDLLDMDLSELNLSRKIKTEKYKPYPRYLERAAELLGSQHYMYRTLLARKHFFEGYLISLSNRNPNTETGQQAMAQFRQTLALDPESPHAWWMMSKVAAYNLLQPDSAYEYAVQALALAPSWILPLTDLATLLAERFGQFERAEALLTRAGRIDSTSVVVWKKLGIVYLAQQKYEEAERLFLRIVAHTPDSVHIPMIYNNLGALYRETGRYDEALRVLQAAIAWDSTQTNPNFNLGLLYESMNRKQEAGVSFRKVIALDTTYLKAYERLAGLYVDAGHNQEALDCLEQAFQNGFLDYAALMNDPAFAALRDAARFWSLLEKYFPGQIKR